MAAPPATARSRAYLVRHLLLSAFLGCCLLASLAGVYFWDKESDADVATPTPPVVPTPVVVSTPTLLHPDPVVSIGFAEDGRFGIMSTLGDPGRSDDDNKLLTFDYVGGTSNTRLSVDGEQPIYGSDEGAFEQAPAASEGVITSIWTYKQVRVTQRLEVVAGAASRLLGTMRIEYLLENQDSIPHEVGLRIMMDTLIGENDGVPFAVPGRSGIVDRAVELVGDQVPDFIQALERPDLVNPGVIVHMTLRGGDATPPDRVVISAWDGSDMPWEYLASLGGEGHPLHRHGVEGNDPDSAVAHYYDPQTLQPGETRTIVTFYGLGGISSTETGNPTLSLTFARQVKEGDSFWVAAMVVNPSDGQTLRIELPAGLALADGETAEKRVTFSSGDAFTQVSWQVKAVTPGEGVIRIALSPDVVTEEQSITVESRGVTR